MGTRRSLETSHEEQFNIIKAETIYTATRQVFCSKAKLRFFGIRFIAIWILPIVVTGAIMEVLFISPTRGVNPFG